MMEMVLLAIGIRTPENIGMLLRVAEAFGVKKIIFSEDVNVENKAVKRISRNGNTLVPTEKTTDILATIADFRNREWQIIALETGDNAIDLATFSINKNSNYLLLIGAERYGIAAQYLQLCDTIVKIAMYGVNSSMNVACSTSILLYEFKKQKQSLYCDEYEKK